MKYLVAWEEDGEMNVICSNKAYLDEYLKDSYLSGDFEEGSEPTVYQLGKQMSVTVETKIITKETKQ